jgi:hypothetical protein
VRALAGEHQVLGTKTGFLPRTDKVFVLGGKTAHSTIALVPLAKAAREVHRWSTWKPWAIFGGGLALVALGGVLDAFAASQMNTFDNSVAAQCGMTGCNGATSTQQIDTKPRETARLESQVGVGILSVGAAATITGIVMLYLNRAHLVYEQPVVVPTPGGATLSFVGAF